MYKEQENGRGKDGSDGIISLVRETADGFGHLIADHIKLARLELVADLKTHGSQVAVIALIVPIIFLGYALICLGLAAVLSPWLGRAGALFLVGGVHIVAGAVAVAIAASRLRRAKPLHDTGIEMDRSVATFTDRHLANGAPAEPRK